MSKAKKFLLGGLVFLVVSVMSLQIWVDLQDRKQLQHIASECRSKGGTFQNGKCSMPDKYSDQGKVCMAMKGTYVVTKDKTTDAEEFTCYSWEGKELAMPDLTGKEVIIMGDGTLLLRSYR